MFVLTGSCWRRTRWRLRLHWALRSAAKPTSPKCVHCSLFTHRSRLCMCNCLNRVALRTCHFCCCFVILFVRREDWLLADLFLWYTHVCTGIHVYSIPSALAYASFELPVDVRFTAICSARTWPRIKGSLYTCTADKLLGLLKLCTIELTRIIRVTARFSFAGSMRYVPSAVRSVRGILHY